MRRPDLGSPDGPLPLHIGALVLGAVVLGAIYTVLPAGWTVLQSALVFVLVCFLPGYAIVSFAYPRTEPSQERIGFVPSRNIERWLVSSPPLSGGERLALGFAVSVVLLPLVPAVVLVVLNDLPRMVLLWSFVSITVTVGLAAGVRSLSVPEESRYVASVPSILAPLAGSRALETGVNVLLATAVLVSVLGFGYALAVPGDGESYTSFALLTESEEGELVAGGYPKTIPRDASRELTVRIVNQEDEVTDYTVVVVTERVRRDGDGVRVLQTRVQDRLSVELDPGERWSSATTVRLNTTGAHRVRYLLYRDEPSQPPAPGEAYRTLHFWTEVPDDRPEG
jgi:uncharacterized membrane protein